MRSHQSNQNINLSNDLSFIWLKCSFWLEIGIWANMIFHLIGGQISNRYCLFFKIFFWFPTKNTVSFIIRNYRRPSAFFFQVLTISEMLKKCKGILFLTHHQLSKTLQSLLFLKWMPRPILQKTFNQVCNDTIKLSYGINLDALTNYIKYTS